MAAELIGPCRCPLCGGKARLSLTKALLPWLTCNGCNIQLAARSDRSDALMRQLLLKDAPAPSPAAAAPAAPVAPAPSPAPSPAPETSAPAPAIPVRTENRPRVGFF